MTIKSTSLLAGIVLLVAGSHLTEALAETKAKSLPPRLREATILSRESPTNRHTVVVALNLRNRDELESFLDDVQNPESPNYGHFLSQEEFNARYGPAVDVEQRLVDHLHASGVTVTDRFSNRLLVRAVGSVAALERAFGVRFYNVTLRGKVHYAAIDEPTLPADFASSVVGVIGLDDLTAPHPHIRDVELLGPKAVVPGTACCHLGPNDLKAFYDESSTYTGNGQTLVIAGAYAWSDADIAAFDSQWGLPALPTGSGPVCTGPAGSPGCAFTTVSTCERGTNSGNPCTTDTDCPGGLCGGISDEISLDVEYAHGTAPGAVILNYMA